MNNFNFNSFLFFLVFSLLCTSANAREPGSLRINLISHSLDNGAGKQVDVSILKEGLESLGHRVKLFDYLKVNGIASSDINIFLAQYKSEWFPKGKLNWFIPNPECLRAKLEDLKKFDLILCKTQESLRIFKPIGKDVYYLGFTSIDCFNPSLQKDYSSHLHVAGKSPLKGSESILKAWRRDPTLPNLTMIRHSRSTKITQFADNVNIINKRIASHSLLSLQNECGVHLCPSKAEGFGHYIMEAMSAEAIVITTDAPPMNEFIKDKRCLVKYKRKGKKNYGVTYFVDEKILAETVRQLQQLSAEEKQSIGQLNREEYLRRAAEFKENLERLMKKALLDLSS